MSRVRVALRAGYTAPRAIDMTNHDDRVAQMLDDKSFHIEFHGYLPTTPSTLSLP